MELVKKANDLIQAKYSLTKNEQRLILYLVGKITKEDKNFQDYSFSFQELSELTEIHKSQIYAETEGIAYSLLKNPISFQLQNNKKLICNWCSSFIFDPENKECTISFDPKLKPFLLQLKKYFTSYNLKYVTGFKSKHSFRVYELCKQYQTLKNRKFTIVEFKALLGLENKYQKIITLKNYVINPALRDINTHSDLVVSVTYHKTRRSITHLTFDIKSGLEHCQNERQEAEILQDKKATAQRQFEQAEIKKTETDWMNKWKKLSDDERKKWGTGSRAFAHFRVKKGILPS